MQRRRSVIAVTAVTAASVTAAAFAWSAGHPETSAVFKPTVSITLPSAWKIGADEQDVFFVDAGNPPEIDIMRAPSVFNPRTGKIVPAPSNVLAWFARHPDVSVGPSKPVRIGGVAGREVDGKVVATPAITGTDLGCDPPGCLKLFHLAGGDLALDPGERFRVIALHAGAAVITIELDAASASWVQFVSKANKALASLRFG